MSEAMVNPQGGQIYSLLGAAMQEIGAIGKDSYNKQQGYQYRGIDAIYNALSPVLSKHGLFFTSEIIKQEREERTTAKGGNLLYSILTMRYRLNAPDGSYITTDVVGEGMDSGDKASNKAMSVAMKYAAFQLFCIPTEELVDPDAETPPQSVPKGHTPPPAYPKCEQCGGDVRELTAGNGAILPPAQVAEMTRKKYGKCLCSGCAAKAKAAKEAQAFDPVAAKEAFCKEHGISANDFANFRTAVIATRKCPDIPVEQLIKADFDMLTDAMKATFLQEAQG